MVPVSLELRHFDDVEETTTIPELGMPPEELFEKDADADFVREMIAFMTQRLMEADVEGLCGAAHGERSEQRSNYRNGYRERHLGHAGREYPTQDPEVAPGRVEALGG